MPRNNNLEPVKLPMKQKWNVPPRTNFKNNLLSIKVDIINAPTIKELETYLPQFVDATWSENPYKVLAPEQRQFLVEEVLRGKTLPTALETIGITFRINGISLQEVTHILRYRNASFSADCSGDKWWTQKDALIPNSIQNSKEFKERYRTIVEDMKQLYVDMIDSKKISLMDARYILPRCLETYYYMRMNLKDCIHFIRQRVDTQIQPETDNILAYKMLDKLSELYPVLLDIIDIDAPAKFYIQTARTGRGTNLYQPEEQNDLFEWHEQDFIYNAKRNELNGTNEGAENLFDLLRDIYRKRFKGRLQKYKDGKNNGK